MRDDMVSVDYGWWHPEWTPGAPDFGMWESNMLACLTTCSVATGEPMIGTWWYNAIECVIRKVDETLSWQDDPCAKDSASADKDDASQQLASYNVQGALMVNALEIERVIYEEEYCGREKTSVAPVLQAARPGSGEDAPDD